MPLWANAEQSPVNSVTCPEALARIMEWDFDPEGTWNYTGHALPHHHKSVREEIGATELLLLVSVVRSSVVT